MATSREGRRATIFEVAEAAGVSITTVSHVFSGKRRVHPDTRSRVLEIADRLAYTPNTKAKALATGRSYALALQVSFTGEALLLNTFFSTLLPTLSLAAVEAGYSFVYVPPLEDGRPFVEPLVQERRVDGAVLVDPIVGDPFVEALSETGLPFVSIGRLVDGSDEHWVDNDHRTVCAEAAEHLRTSGYTRPALVTIESPVSYVADYLAGFRAAFGSDARIVVAREFSTRAATEATLEALAADDPPDAFFCIHDQLALAVEVAVESSGLRVGADVGIVGVGDSVFARDARTPLTSVAVYPESFGQAAVDMLDALVRGEAPEAPVLIPTTLMPRASTARVPSGRTRVSGTARAAG